MKYKQFEVWLADLNPRFGTEAGKTRPVLSVPLDLLNKVHSSSVICPIATNVKSKVTILRVNLTQGEAGLNKDSVIMIDQASGSRLNYLTVYTAPFVSWLRYSLVR